METVPFDYMEISYIFPEDRKKAAVRAIRAGTPDGAVHAHRLAAISLGGGDGMNCIDKAFFSLADEIRSLDEKGAVLSHAQKL